MSYKSSGFGEQVNPAYTRYIRKDGKFNVHKKNISFLARFSAYHYLIKLSWTKFIGIVFLFYLILNLLFALSYFLLGVQHLGLTQPLSTTQKLQEAFFFSIQTFTTVGYGRLSPLNFTTNIVASLEALCGILTVGLISGLAYARFSRPVANIVFSDSMLIAPYREGEKALMVRCVNAKMNQLTDVSVELLLSWNERNHHQKWVRRFYKLPLEIKHINFFATSWTIVHPLDENSVLYEVTPEQLTYSDAELVVYMRAFDDTFSQTIQTHQSYKYDEVVFDAKFITVFEPTEKGNIQIDLAKLSHYEKV